MASSELRRASRYLILFALVLAAYGPILKVGFLWDDHVFIERNPYIQSWAWTNLKHDFASTVSNGEGDAGYLRPAVTWSNRLDYSIWALRPFGYHLTSLALHYGNTLLLYELILLLGCTPLTALLTACLFAVHPIGVEGLICVTGRATFLSFFFGISALLLLAEPTPNRIVWGLSSFGLALLSKEESVVLPFLLPLLWIVRGAPKKRYWLLLPLLAILGIYLIYRHHLFGSVGAPKSIFYTLRFFLQAFPRILGHYVRLILVPWNLHSHRLLMHLSHFWILWLAGWGTASLLAWRWRDKYPWIFFCVYWFVIGLIPPAMAMVYGGFVLDHWGYWVAPAVLLPLGVLFNALWTHGRHERIALLFFPLLIGYALLVRLNVELRGTDEKMYRWALNFTTSHPIQYNLGQVLLHSGRAGEAIIYFEEVQAVYPEDIKNTYALAQAYEAAGHPKVAIHELEVLLQRDPSYQPAIESLRALKMRRGRK